MRFNTKFALIFVLSFLLPIVAGYYFIFRTGNSNSYSNHKDDKNGKSEFDPDNSKSLIPRTIRIKSSGVSIRAENSQNFFPIADHDFFVFCWLRVKKMPEEGERGIFAINVEKASGKQGYAMALSRNKQELRPEIYWKGKSKEPVNEQQSYSGWLSFPAIPDYSGLWTLYVLSFRQDKFLGLHTVALLGSSKPQVKLSGGYLAYSAPRFAEITREGDDRAQLLFGSPANAFLNAELGPFGILQLKRDSYKFKDVVKEIAVDSGRIPDGFSKNDIMLWSSDGRVDLSPYGHDLIVAK